MANRRMLSKSISTSLKLARLKTTEAKLLFTWLIPHCDDDGRTQGEPLVVKGLVIPLLDCTINDINAWLSDLHEQKLIFWYEIDSEKYIQINKWLDHQDIRKDRYKSSLYPPPPPDNQKTTKRQPRVAKRPPNLREGNIREGNIREVNNPPTPQPVEIELPEWLDKELWNQFKEHRKGFKPGLSFQAEQLNLKKLIDLHNRGHDPQKIIEETIANGWKSFYETKNGNHPLKGRFSDKTIATMENLKNFIGDEQ